VSAENAEQCCSLNIVGIVGSIDNDFCGTDMTVGTDSALFRIIEAIDNIATTAFRYQQSVNHVGLLGMECGAADLLNLSLAVVNIFV